MKLLTAKELIDALVDEPLDAPVYLEEIDDSYVRIVPLNFVVAAARTFDGRIVLGSGVDREIE